MDFHALPRHDLQVLAKRNGVRANMTNGAMADALAALPAVDGIEEFVQEPVAESTPAAEPVVQATAEEEEKEEAPSEEEPEKQEISLPGGQGVALTPHEVIVLDDSEEEEKNLSPGENEEKALGAGRRRATRRGRVEPVAAPATRKRAASSKADKADAAVEAVPARATRARSQRTVVSVAEEEAPNTRRTSRRAVTSKTGTEQEEGEKKTQGDVSDVEADVPALISSDDGEMEVATDVQNEEQNEPAEEQSQEDEVEAEKGDAAADVVPPRATRARRQRTVLSVAHEEEQGQEDEVEAEKGDAAADALPARSTRGRSKRAVLPVAEEEAPKTRRTSRRAAASKTCMQQEVEEKGPQRDVSDVEAAVPAPASSDEGSDGAEVAQKEEQKQSQEDDGETQKVAAEAVPARATRARRQRTAESVAEEEAPKTRRTSRRAVASKTGTQQEEEEKRTHGDVSHVEADVPALVSYDEGCDGAGEMEVAIDAQNEEQNEPVEEQSQEDDGEAEKGDATADAVPARATRARRQKTVLSVAQEEEQSHEDEVETEKGDAAADAAPARATRARRQRVVVSVPPAEEQSQEDDIETEKGDAAADAVPARATRARSQRTVLSEPEQEEAPKPRRTSRRAAASKTCMQKEVEEKGAQRDVSDVEAAVPAPASSDEGSDGAEVAQNEEQKQSQEDDGETQKGDAAAEAVPVRATRARRQRTAEPVAEEEAPKARRTSRRAAASEVSDVEAAVPAPASSDEGGDGAEAMEVVKDAQNGPVEEQSQGDEGQTEKGDAAVDAVPARATRARRQRAVVSVAEEEEAPKTRRTSRRATARKTSTEQEQGEKATQGDVSDMEAAPVSSTEGDAGAVEMEVAVAAQNEEHLAAAEAVPARATRGRSRRTVVSVAEDEAPKAKRTSRRAVARKTRTEQEEEERATQGDVSQVKEAVLAPVSSEEEGETGTEEVEVDTNAQNEEQNELAAEQCPEEEGETGVEATEEVEVAEDVDSVQELLVDVQPCEATEEIHLAGEDTEMVAGVPQAMLESGEATEEFHCSSAVAEESEEESPVAEHADSVQEPLVDVQQCVATEQIHLASEDAEMVAVLESGEATEEVDCTRDVAEASEEEPPVAEHVDASVQEPLVDVQQCEATEEIHPVSEDTDMVPVLESGEATEEGYFTGNVSYASEETEAPASDEVLQSPAKAVEENEDTAADEVPHNTDEYVEEEAVVATDEVPQASEAMDQDVVEVVTVENLTQGTVTDDECAIKESGFTADFTDVSMEEEAAVLTADEMSLAAMGESVKEVTVQIMSQATLACDVKESGFSGDLTDVSLEDKEVVAADGMPQSSATMEANVEEVITVGDLSQATVTDDQGAVKESVFSCGLAVLSVDEESSETMNKDVEEVATEADDEWAVTESAFTGDCTPVVDTARDFSDHIASPLSANVFEDATKSLSITAEPMVSESADVPLCMYSSSGGEKNTSEPVAMQRENEPEAASFDRIMHSPLSIRKLRMAVAQEYEADSVPRCLTIRKLRTNLSEPVAVEPMVAEPADDVPLCYSSSSGKKNASEPVAVQLENEVKDGGNQPEAVAVAVAHSPLSIRKVRMAVAQEIEADSVPRCLTIRKQPRTSLNIEKMAVQPENEVLQEGNQPEAAAFGRMMHSPLSIRKLRMAVAQENEAGSVCLTIRKLSRTNLTEKAAVTQENEVKEGEISSVPLDKLSLRKLRNKLREKMAVQPENEVQEGNQPEAAAFGRIMHSPLSIRKLRMAVAQENEAGSVCLTIRKLSRTNLTEKAAVAQENEVKEGEKSSVPLDKLSLRKLRVKLRETLNAHQNIEPKRVPLGRLDENAR